MAATRAARLANGAAASTALLPRFWSGDNPIVVTTGTLMFLGVASSLVRGGGTGQALLDLAVVSAGLAFGLGRLRLK